MFRRSTQADIDIYARWFADPELARRLAAPTEEWRHHLKMDRAALWTAVDGYRRPIAFIQTERHSDGVVWFDCAIDPQLWGRGRMVAILSAFLEGPLAAASRIAAEVERDNHASLRLLQRLNFVENTQQDGAEFRHFDLERSASKG